MRFEGERERGGELWKARRRRRRRRRRRFTRRLDGVFGWKGSIFARGSISRGKATPRPFCIIDAWWTAFMEWGCLAVCGSPSLACRNPCVTIIFSLRTTHYPFQLCGLLPWKYRRAMGSVAFRSNSPI